MLPIDRSAHRPLVEQVYDGVRTAIESETIAAGARLPSTREFAKQLGLTRFTVDDAYARLISEGYLVARHGSGTYVAERVRVAPQQDVVELDTDALGGLLSRWATRLPEQSPVPAPRRVEFDFQPGNPSLEEMPIGLWNRTLVREGRELDPLAYTYGDVAGLPRLREAIAGYVSRSRGVTCTPDQVVITTGVQQAMDLVFRLTVDPGDTVVIEEPGYPSVRAIARLADARLVPVPVDAEGLVVDRLPGPSLHPRLLYVTPSHQHPTGAILPLTRRIALLEWACAARTIVLEDDYDSELRYDARPVPALAALALAQPQAIPVIYMGTFSKVLFPALRLGYLVLPPALVGPMVAAKAATDRYAPAVSQATMAAFIEEGHFERHLVRMRRVYASRHQAMVDALDRHFGVRAERVSSTASAGLSMLVRFDVGLDEAELVARAAAAGISLEGASRCYTTPPSPPQLVIGYAMLPEERIEAGIARLAEVVLP
jgi:GntR family transcriptional regulator/MocR family aminotransferase